MDISRIENLIDDVYISYDEVEEKYTISIEFKDNQTQEECDSIKDFIIDTLS